MPSPGATEAVQILRLSGYPLDRSLEGLVAYPNLDVIAVVSEVRLGSPRWTTPDGQPPVYVSENRAPSRDEVGTYYTIITPATATIVRSLRGAFKKGMTIALALPGGRVGSYQIDVSDDVGPSVNEVAGGERILLAGRLFGAELEPSFVYSVGPGAGRVRSLVASASDKEPNFDVEELVRALASRP